MYITDELLKWLFTGVIFGSLFFVFVIIPFLNQKEKKQKVNSLRFILILSEIQEGNLSSLDEAVKLSKRDKSKKNALQEALNKISQGGI